MALPTPLQLQTTAATRYLRRKFTTGVAWTFNNVSYTGDVAGLHALADAIFPLATQTVTLRDNSYEGGHAAGDITFDKTVLLTVLEALILELDPAAPVEPPTTVLLDYSYRPVHA